MKEVFIFGRKHTVVKRRSNHDMVRRKNGQVVVSHNSELPHVLLQKFLAKELHNQLNRIYGQIKKKGEVELFGNLDFEVVGNIDNKKRRIAKLSGNKILVKLNAIALKRSALRYIIAHEIAHSFTKKHTEKFWKVLRVIYPSFKRGMKVLTELEPLVRSPVFHPKGN